MALNVSLSNNTLHQQSFDRQALKSTVRKILGNAETKVSNYSSKKLDVDLYNGEIDAMTARQVAMSGSGLNVKLNRNLETAINFLKTKAAVASTEAVKAEVVSIETAKNANPFADLTDKKESFLFIKAA